MLLFGFTWTALGEPQKWPEGPGQSLVQRNCLICHSAEIIQGQRLSRETWLKEVEKMAGWGSPIPAADREALADYLFQHYSPETPLPEPERERIKF
jgi:mono/diheme cytochrome c family protein